MFISGHSILWEQEQGSFVGVLRADEELVCLWPFLEQETKRSSVYLRATHSQPVYLYEGMERKGQDTTPGKDRTPGCLVSLIGHHTIIIFFRVSGFVAGDDGFSIGNRKNSGQIYFRFHIAQHWRDHLLMKLFILFFECGKVNIRSNTERCDYYVQDFQSIYNKIIASAHILINFL